MKLRDPHPIQAQAIPRCCRAAICSASPRPHRRPPPSRCRSCNAFERPSSPAPYTTRALILAPTRELAAQIADSFRAYASSSVPPSRDRRRRLASPQIDMLARGLDVLVATPGVCSTISARPRQAGTTEVIVLDEADHMLDLGFVVPIRQIVANCLRFAEPVLSATMPKEIAGLAGDMLKTRCM